MPKIAWDNLSEDAIRYVIIFISAIVIFLIGKWIAKIVTGLVEKSLEKSRVEPTLASFIKNVTYYAILVLVLIATLSKLGVQTNSFVAIIGAASLAIGLALQGSLTNLAAGVLIIVMEPFKVGDMIEAGGVVGRVKEIQIFSTILVAEDKMIIMPNSKITSDRITLMNKK